MDKSMMEAGAMESMINRVALALAKARGYASIGQTTPIELVQRAFGPQIFKEARAAIRAMREPTEAINWIDEALRGE